jgi:hypothetical protein
MATLTPTAAKGQTQFEAAAPWRNHDSAADRRSGGSYAHEPKEFAATEADEWASWMLFLTGLLKAGHGALPVRCASSLIAGHLVYVTTYDGTNSVFTVAKADADDPAKPAQFVMRSALGANTNGHAYAAGEVTGLDTSGAAAVGDPVYLSGTAGAWTLTAPTAPQLVGRVTVKHATTGAIAFMLHGVDDRAALLSPLGGGPPSNPVIGQRWFEAATKIEWFWNGTKWLSAHVETWSWYAVPVNGGAYYAPLFGDGTYEVYCEAFTVSGIAPSNNDATHYMDWRIGWFTAALGTSFPTGWQVSTINKTASQGFSVTANPGALSAVIAGAGKFFFVQGVVTGANPDAAATAILRYRLVRP